MVCELRKDGTNVQKHRRSIRLHFVYFNVRLFVCFFISEYISEIQETNKFKIEVNVNDSENSLIGTELTFLIVFSSVV